MLNNFINNGVSEYWLNPQKVNSVVRITRKNTHNITLSIIQKIKKQLANIQINWQNVYFSKNKKTNNKKCA